MLTKDERQLLVCLYRKTEKRANFELDQEILQSQEVFLRLRNRGLIKTDLRGKGKGRVGLTPDGIRLGEIYNGGLWGRGGLWLTEHKWLSLFILTLLAAVIAGLLLKYLP